MSANPKPSTELPAELEGFELERANGGDIIARDEDFKDYKAPTVSVWDSEQSEFVEYERQS